LVSITVSFWGGKKEEMRGGGWMDGKECVERLCVCVCAFMCDKAKGRKGARKTEKSTAVVEQEAAWFSVDHRTLLGG